MQNRGKDLREQDLEDMANAAEFISLGDSINRQVRTNQHWSLLPDLGTCAGVAPAMIVQGKSFYPRFPEWLGKNSSQRKSKRQIKELKAVMGMNAYAKKQEVQTIYVPLVLNMLYKALTQAAGSSGEKAQDAIELLDSFKLTSDMFKEHLLDLCMNKAVTEKFGNLNSGTKAAFTRAYNATHKVPTAKKGGKRGAASKEDSDAEETDDDDAFGILNEDELAEIKKAKRAEREKEEQLKAQKIKVDEFTMIKASLNDEEGPGKKGKKGKAKTKKTPKTAKNKKRGKSDSEDDLDGFIVDDDDDLGYSGKRKKAKTTAKR